MSEMTQNKSEAFGDRSERRQEEEKRNARETPQNPVESTQESGLIYEFCSFLLVSIFIAESLTASACSVVFPSIFQPIPLFGMLFFSIFE
jgi:hypothetical protein